jgi:hypothetical protein
MTWHADGVLLERYAEGRIDDATALSVEAHLAACPVCRVAASSLVDPTSLERIWTEVRRTVDRSTPRLVERALVRVGLPEHTGRVLVVASAVTAPWIVAVALTLAFAALAAHAGGGGPLPFLIAAPLVPVAGVALAYGGAADPLHEIGLASPTGGFRLVLMRSAGVVLVSIALAGVAALALPQLGWIPAGWLVPSLALSALTLALSTASRATPGAVGTAIGIGWGAWVAVAETIATQPYAAFGPAAQVGFGSLLAIAGWVLVARRGALELRTRI